jgi:hypothetical protein
MWRYEKGIFGNRGASTLREISVKRLVAEERETMERNWIRPEDMSDELAEDIDAIHYELEHGPDSTHYWREQLRRAWRQYDLECQRQARHG